jgi:hypothetical protein
LVTEETYRYVDEAFPNAPLRELELKGKSDPVRARVLIVGDDVSSHPSV